MAPGHKKIHSYTNRYVLIAGVIGNNMCKAEKIESVMNANDETAKERAAMMLNIRECHHLS